MYFKSDGTPDMEKQDKLKQEIDMGLWDNYLLWSNEAYDNLVKGSDLTNKFLQMATPQHLQNQQNTTTDENR